VPENGRKSPIAWRMPEYQTKNTLGRAAVVVVQAAEGRSGRYSVRLLPASGTPCRARQPPQKLCNHSQTRPASSRVRDPRPRTALLSEAGLSPNETRARARSVRDPAGAQGCARAPPGMQPTAPEGEHPQRRRGSTITGLGTTRLGSGGGLRQIQLVVEAVTIFTNTWPRIRSVL
jgi:hypothetical protein